LFPPARALRNPGWGVLLFPSSSAQRPIAGQQRRHAHLCHVRQLSQTVVWNCPPSLTVC
jgi:hypothetical protein